MIRGGRSGWPVLSGEGSYPIRGIVGPNWLGPGLKRSPLTTGSRHRPASEYEEETLSGSRCLPVSFLNRRELPAQPEFGDECPVTSHIFPSKVVEQTTAASHHLEETPARSVVATELLQMFGQVRDALREHRDLHLRGTSVARRTGVLGDELGLACGIEWHMRQCYHLPRQAPGWGRFLPVPQTGAPGTPVSRIEAARNRGHEQGGRTWRFCAS